MNKLFTSINNINYNFWKRIVASTELNAESMYVFRIITGLYLLCIHSPNFVWIGKVPQAFFSPPFFSLARLFDGFPGSNFFLAINIILLLLAVALTVGFKARMATLGYALTFIVANSFQFSFGKIDHSSMLYVALLVCMGFTNWGVGLAILPDKPVNPENNRRALSILAVFICFAFFTAGFAKAIRWINFDINSNGMGSWYYNKLYLRRYMLAPYLVDYFPFWGFKVLDFIGVVFELSPIFFLLKSRKFWNAWLITACLFHTCNAVILNISFLPLSIVYLSFANFNFIYKYLNGEKPFSRLLYYLLPILVVVLSIRLYYLLNDIESSVLFISSDQVEINLYFSIIIWFGIISLIARGAYFNKNDKLNVHKYRTLYTQKEEIS